MVIGKYGPNVVRYSVLNHMMLVKCLNRNCLIIKHRLHTMLNELPGPPFQELVFQGGQEILSRQRYYGKHDHCGKYSGRIERLWGPLQ